MSVNKSEWLKAFTFVLKFRAYELRLRNQSE